MKVCKSITRWRDLEDGHLYNPGDAFPHDGREISDERIARLASKQNRAGFALIQVDEVQDEGKPVRAAESQKKAIKSRKKTT